MTPRGSGDSLGTLGRKLTSVRANQIELEAGSATESPYRELHMALCSTIVFLSKPIPNDEGGSSDHPSITQTIR